VGDQKFFLLERRILGAIFEYAQRGGTMFASVLSGDAQNALALLGGSGLLSQAYLAGGSALALQFGHRRSEDFDFFSPHPFSPDELGRALSALGRFTQTFAKELLEGDGTGTA
jgi:hypothetical protein